MCGIFVIRIFEYSTKSIRVSFRIEELYFFMIKLAEQWAYDWKWIVNSCMILTAAQSTATTPNDAHTAHTTNYRSHDREITMIEIEKLIRRQAGTTK